MWWAVCRMGLWYSWVCKPVSWDFFESMVETLDVLNDAELMASIRRGIQEMVEGRGKPLEDVKRELGLE
jgi:hypothetical protein